LLQGFEKVFRHLDTFQGGGSLEGWLRRIMVREALQHLRKRSLLFVQPKEDDPGETPRPSWADAAEGLAIDDLMEAVASLPSNFRTVFNLTIVEGFSHEEISHLLGITEATSRSQLFRARQMLQKILEAEAATLTKTHR
jgi:RNA polymerase sigma-70 factor (ECF subfamily)